MTKQPLTLQSLALAAGALLALSGPAYAEALSEADQQADRAAQQNVEQAMSQIDAQQWRAARESLEKAETALLNRESLDLGPALDASKPLPKTEAMKDIDAARLAVASHDKARAHDAAARVDKEIGVEIGAAQTGTGPNGSV